jgi:hypothetical protein
MASRLSNAEGKIRQQNKEIAEKVNLIDKSKISWKIFMDSVI